MRKYLLRTAGAAVKVELDPTCGNEPLKPGVALKKRPVLGKGEKTDLRVRLTRKDLRGGLGSRDKGLTGIKTKRLKKGVFRVCFDKSGLTAHCSYSGGIPSYFAATLAVNYAFQFFQEEMEVVFFHAAAMVIRGKAYLFPAPSGGGKSTISRLAKKRGIKVIGDDTCVVKRKGRKFFVSAYPLFALPARGRNTWEIDSVFFLEKSKTNGMKSMSSVEAMKRAIPEAMCFYSKQKMAPARRECYSKHVFRTLSSMFDSVRFAQLSFSRNGGVFSCLG
jgi:hypothetical protein